MKITQFYPESIENSSFVSILTFEPGGIFIQKNSQLYYNTEKVVLVVSSICKITREDESYKFSSFDGDETLVIKSKEINSQSNISEKVAYSIQVKKVNIDKSEKSKLISEIESSLLENLIDLALEERNEELFNNLVKIHRKNLQFDISN